VVQPQKDVPCPVRSHELVLDKDSLVREAGKSSGAALLAWQRDSRFNGIRGCEMCECGIIDGDDGIE
jgi:hypothetical protein